MKVINRILIGNKRRIGLAFVLLFSCVASIDAVPFVVTTTVDNGNNGSPTPGSLRAGINAVNAATNDAINFNIPTADPGYNASNNTWTIQPPVDLPNIINTVIIDGYTQPGSSVNTLAQGDNAVLTIILNGSNYTVGNGLVTGNGLHFVAGSDGSLVRGLVINQWLGNGILVDAHTANITGISIIGCFIGTDSRGIEQIANRIGIGLAGRSGHNCINIVIGTSAFYDRNIIAGSFGFSIGDSYGLAGGCISCNHNQGTTIKNNYIGIDVSGTLALGNSSIGIRIANTTLSTVGGSTSAERNIVSGHALSGILFGSGTQNCTAQGNYIGTDVAGVKALGNGFAGITLNGGNAPTTFDNVIQSNLISGNENGIFLGMFDVSGANNNSVKGNLIGTDFSGTKLIPNIEYGIVLNDGQNIIGGITTEDRNIISGNNEGGILVYSNIASANLVEGNYIGIDITGIKKLPNRGNGVQIGLNGGFGGASNNIIGA